MNELLTNAALAITIIGFPILIWQVITIIKYPGSISFINKSIYTLSSEFTKRVDGLQINFKNSPISTDVSSISGYIVNSGYNDLSFEENFRISLPNNFKLLDFKILSTSPDLECKFRIENDSVFFVCKNFLRNEYIKIQCLVDKKEGSNKTDSPDIIFIHRIKNTSQVKFLKFKKSDGYQIFNDLILVALAIFAIYTSIQTLEKRFFFGKTHEVAYFVSNKEKRANVGYLENINETSLKKTTITLITGSQKEEIPVKEFIEKFNVETKLTHIPSSERTIIVNYLFSSFYVIFGLWLLFSIASRRYKQIKFKKIDL